MPRPRKFTDEDVAEIKRMYFEVNISVRDLTEAFNVSSATIYKILHDSYPKQWEPKKPRKQRLEGEVILQEQA